jgi:hypothetical protein
MKKKHFEILLPSLFPLLDFRNGWLIRTATKSFAVYAATATEKQEWMAHINKCIEDLLRKSMTNVNSILFTKHFNVLYSRWQKGC